MKFWHNVWCGDNPLSTCFPDLFRISNDKEAYVADLMQFPNRVLFWDLEFLREIHDRELVSLSVFWDIIYGVSLRGIGEDKMHWTLAKSKGFKVSSYYQALLGVCTQSFPWRSIWKQKVPSRVAFFVWIATLGTILTIDNLRKKKALILDWCYMRKSKGESVDYLLLHCPIVYEFWSMVFTLFDIHWVMPKSVVELLACWQGNFGHHCNGAIWMAVPHCLMWCIWRERNNQCFEDSKKTIANLKLFFFKTLLDWMSIIGSYSIFWVYGLMNACNLCI